MPDTTIDVERMAAAFAAGIEAGRQALGGEEIAKVFYAFVAERIPELDNHEGMKMMLDKLIEERKVYHRG